MKYLRIRVVCIFNNFRSTVYIKIKEVLCCLHPSSTSVAPETNFTEELSSVVESELGSFISRTNSGNFVPQTIMKKNKKRSSANIEVSGNSSNPLSPQPPIELKNSNRVVLPPIKLKPIPPSDMPSSVQTNSKIMNTDNKDVIQSVYGNLPPQTTTGIMKRASSKYNPVKNDNTHNVQSNLGHMESGSFKSDYSENNSQNNSRKTSVYSFYLVISWRRCRDKNFKTNDFKCICKKEKISSSKSTF